MKYKVKWAKKNLKYFIKFLEEQDGEINIDKIANLCNTSKASVYHFFLKDDMKLSKIENIVSLYGYRLKLFCPIKEQPFMLYIDKQKEFKNAGNLESLLQYINNINLSFWQLAQKMKVSHSVILSMKKGDTSISNLNNIEKLLHIRLKWIFEKV